MAYIISNASFTRPSDTTPYASGDLVANSTTAASVAAMSFGPYRADKGVVRIRRVRLKKSGTTATNGSFRVHFYTSDPCATAPTNGDNGAWATVNAGYLGSLDVTVGAFTDACLGVGSAAVNAEIVFGISGADTTVYSLIEARAAYTPASAEVFTLTPEIEIVYP